MHTDSFILFTFIKCLFYAKHHQRMGATTQYLKTKFSIKPHLLLVRHSLSEQTMDLLLFLGEKCGFRDLKTYKAHGYLGELVVLWLDLERSLLE